MAISVIIPAYNASAYIEHALNSVITQTYCDWQCFVVDDCSTDNTAEIVQDYVMKDSRISYLQTPNNMGAFGARNLGIEKSQGDYIAFLDADDIWKNNKLQVQIDFMHSNDCDISCHNYGYINAKGQTIQGIIFCQSTYSLLSYMGNTNIGMSTVMLKANVFVDIQFENVVKREDTKFWIDCLGCKKIVLGINDNLSSYRVYNGQISSNKIEMALLTFKLYMIQSYVNKFTALNAFIKYAINSILKRM